MPFRSRRYGYRRRTFRRGRLYGRSRPTRKYALSRRFYRRRRSTASKWYNRRFNFKERFESGIYQFNTPSSPAAGLSLQISDCPLWTSRQNLGDQFKIYKWKIEIVPSFQQPPGASENGLINTLTSRMGDVRTALVPDYTDDSVPVSWDQMIQHPYARIKPWPLKQKMIIRPKVALMAYETATTTGYKTGAGWISRSDPTVKHYGFKFMINAASWHPSGMGDFEFTYRLRHTVYYGIKNVQCTL